MFGEKLIDFDLDSLMKYCKSIVSYFSLNHPLGQRQHRDDFLKTFNQEANKRIPEEYNMNILWNNGINEASSNDSIPLIHDINRFGSEKHSKDLQKSIQEEIFWKEDDKFKPPLNNLNENLHEKSHNRSLKEREIEISKSVPGSCFSYYLVGHMCEMYDYGFIEGKSILPTPAVYILYLLQLLLNIKCCVTMLCQDENVVPCYEKDGTLESIGSPINSETKFNEWGFTLENGHYIPYKERKHTTIPFTWTQAQSKN